MKKILISVIILFEICYSSDWTNKLVFITGGATGIGLGTAVHFAKKGAHVVICSRNTWKYDNVAKPAIEQANISTSEFGKVDKITAKYIEYLNCDVRLEDSMKDTIGLIFKKYGRLDTAYNNAGVFSMSEPLMNKPLNTFRDKSGTYVGVSTPIQSKDCPAQQKQSYKQQFGVNKGMPQGKNFGKNKCCPDGTRFVLSDECENDVLTDTFGLFNAMKYELKQMRGNTVNGGIGNGNPSGAMNSIINTCSTNSFIPSPGDILQNTAKSACVAITRSTALENTNIYMKSIMNVDSPNIRINAVLPGSILTPFQRAQVVPGILCKESYNILSKLLKHDPKLTSLELYEKQPADYEQLYLKEMDIFWLAPVGRMGRVEDIANAVEFLADSSISSFYNAWFLMVDGGSYSDRGMTVTNKQKMSLCPTKFDLNDITQKNLRL